MNADCPICKEEGTVDYLGRITMRFCVCEACAVVFVVEPDADYDDGWRDCSVPGAPGFNQQPRSANKPFAQLVRDDLAADVAYDEARDRAEEKWREDDYDD